MTCLLVFWAVFARGALSDVGGVGQSTEPSWAVASFSEDLELEDVNVLEVDMDADGNLWIATTKGLYLFDGYRVVLRIANDSLPGSFPRCVRVARDGTVWMGGDEGPVVYDRATDEFRMVDGLESLAGRSVRRIVEDPDGALWFCCDSWPTLEGDEGLAVFKNGVLTEYSWADGLPSDSILDYFRDSTGRQFAMTRNGIAQKSGEEWVNPFVGTDLPRTQQSIWTAAESGEHGLVFGGTTDIFLLGQDGWKQVPTRHDAVKICAGPGGSIIAFEDTASGVFAFQEWNGVEFVPVAISTEVPEGGWIQCIRYFDQDGSVWSGSLGSLVRWSSDGGEWKPFPVKAENALTDFEKRLWLVGETNTLMQVGTNWTSTETLAGLESDVQGHLWRVEPNGVVSWQQVDGWMEINPQVTGFSFPRRLRLSLDGTPWIVGTNSQAATSFAVYHGGVWSPVVHDVFRNKTITTTWAGGGGSLWCTVETGNPRLNQLAQVFPDRVEWALESGALFEDHIIHFLETDDGDLWVCTDTRVLCKSADESEWSVKADFPGYPIAAVVQSGDDLWFANSSHIAGRSAVTRKRGDDWVSFDSKPLQTLRKLWDGSVILGQRNQFQWLNRSNLLTISTPYSMVLRNAALDSTGQLWLINERKEVLRFQADGVPPETSIVHINTNIITGNQLPLELISVERFIPRSSSRPATFSTRIDNGTWSEFEKFEGMVEIAINNLPTGRHSIEVRARDEAGDIDSTPATLAFNIIPIPLQDRAWFLPVLLLLLGTLVALGGYSLIAWRQMARANEHLEIKVKQRTRQLEADIALRRKAEAALRKNEMELESNVAKRTRELAATNEELASFSYTVSHDLKAPLRNINGFCQILVSSLKKGNTSAVQHALSRVQASATRMGQLIDDLLQLARVSRVPMKLQAVDLAELAREISRELNELCPERTVCWNLPEQLTVVADRGLVRSVLQNLLSNAWKYSGNKTDSVISFEQCDIDGEKVCSISDNGVGFDMQYADKLFKPFSRLHGQTEFEGEGIGLATVHRIIERHHGRVWGESTLGEGAVFFFTFGTSDSDAGPAESS